MGWLIGIAVVLCIAVLGVLVLGGVFAAYLLSYRNKALDFQERIRMAKSTVRVAKSKYVKVMRNSAATDSTVNNASQCAAGLTNGGSGGIGGTFVTSVDMVNRLADEYQAAQLRLNFLVKEWNTFIGKFPNVIFSTVLRLKKEEYIDESKLEKSTELSEMDEELA